MTAYRVATLLASASALSWLVPAATWPWGYAPDLVLALTVMVAAAAPLDRAALPIMVAGLIDDCLAGGIFGSRALSLFLIAMAAGTLVRHMHAGTLWVRLVLLFGASLAAPILVSSLGYGGVRLGFSVASATVTTLAGFLVWGVAVTAPTRNAAW